MSPSPNRSSKSKSSGTSKGKKPSEPVSSSTPTPLEELTTPEAQVQATESLPLVPESQAHPTPPEEFTTSNSSEAEPVQDIVVPVKAARKKAAKTESTEVKKAKKAEKTSEVISSAENEDDLKPSITTSVPSDLEREAVPEVIPEPQVSDPSAKTEEVVVIPRNHPIPPPTEIRQYRAVGLVQARYLPSAEQFTQGKLITSDGTEIDAVLLGRVMSLVKNHIDQEKEHLWVVYPRTRQENGNLHAQVMGVWEPETLNKIDDNLIENDHQWPPLKDGYFSVRGEVIYQAQEDPKYLIVKIKQAPRKKTDLPKFFKLKLDGCLATKAVGHFFDIQVQLKGNSLLIQQANDIGLLEKQPSRFGGRGNKSFKPRGDGATFKPRGDAPARPSRPDGKPDGAGEPQTPRTPLPKPIKKVNKE